MMLAIATVLSLIKLVDLPYGGSVTIASMLPMVIVSYRHGVRWGLVAGVTYGIIQQLLGLNTLSWVSTWQSIVAVILLDYVLAFMATGFGGVFRGMKSQALALVLGSIVVGFIRYACHLVSGATVWAGLSIPTNAALGYSAGYNATYMVPETIVLAVVAWYLGSMLDFRKPDLARLSTQGREEGVPVLAWLGGLAVAAGLIFDCVAIFSKLQNAETGDFDITGLTSVNWPAVGIVSVVAAAAAAVLFLLANRKKRS